MDLNQLQYWLQFFALVFFNLFCVLGILTALFTLTVVSKLSKKGQELIENAQEVLDNGGRVAESLADFLEGFGGKKRGIVRKILGLFL
jgi:hypothetical protein